MKAMPKFQTHKFHNDKDGGIFRSANETDPLDKCVLKLYQSFEGLEHMDSKKR